ncbi:DUF3164 family protein [Flammeovirga sp. OC4]|uniref:DUF3164 family protein n=1 Tax=Flammeovirga sp. OC4 TaxID=1382345 RepID=UPI0005C65C8A|nr:DUF3164 family protein [Flammeovirga sp. OC4]
MTQEEEKLLAELQAKKQDEVKSKRLSYEELKADLLEKWVKKFKEEQARLIALKTEAYEEITTFLKIMEEYGEVKKEQQGSSILNDKYKVQFTMRPVREYDERAELGASKVREWIKEEFSDERQAEFILDLLDKNSQGKFDYQKIQKIAKHAQENNITPLLEAVALFNEAYGERYTKFYFQVFEKGIHGGYDSIVLTFSSLSIDEGK